MKNLSTLCQCCAEPMQKKKSLCLAIGTEIFCIDKTCIRTYKDAMLWCFDFDSDSEILKNVLTCVTSDGK